MGCCASTPRSETGTSLAQPTTQAPPQSSHSSRHPITTGSGYDPPPHRALSQVFNAPLKPHFWSPRDRHWSQSELNAERQVFWDTAITNRPEIWASLHLVCEELITIPAATVKLWGEDGSGEVGGEREGRDSPGPPQARPGVKPAKDKISNAQAIISAAGITLPTGDLVDGVYDTFGNHYTLPVWVVCNPETLRTEESIPENDGVKAVLPGPTDGADEDDIDILKGKGREAILEVEKPKMEMIKVKCRLTDGRRDVIVEVEKGAKVRVLIERVAEIAEAKVRLVYLGKMLDKNIPLAEQGWREGDVVQGLVFPSS